MKKKDVAGRMAKAKEIADHLNKNWVFQTTPQKIAKHFDQKERRHKQQKERYATDPDYKARVDKRKANEKYERKVFKKIEGKADMQEKLYPTHKNLAKRYPGYFKEYLKKSGQWKYPN